MCYLLVNIYPNYIFISLWKQPFFCCTKCMLLKFHVLLWIILFIRKNLLFVAVFLGCTSTGRVGLWFCGLNVQEHLKAQLVVVLDLKHLRRWGYGLKSHPTDWEKLGIEFATPGLQDIDLNPTPTDWEKLGIEPATPGLQDIDLNPTPWRLLKEKSW